jgi:4-alpha-glucanotransferase
MTFARASGVLLHPTSLPGPFGIGDIGPAAHRWIDFLAAAGCELWQTLPLGPTSYKDSPYQSFSAFAGNLYLISPEYLIRDGLLIDADLLDLPRFPEHRVDYGPVITWKLALLDRSFQRFVNAATTRVRAEFAAFERAQAEWLEDFALFMALKDAHGGAAWISWAEPLRKRLPSALAEARQDHAQSITKHKYGQFLFFRQWRELKLHAGTRSVRIIGDIPIFVALDSSDVWASPELFYLDREGAPTCVAGVPPDYFSPTGQLWGNPLYRWERHKETGYAWWLARLRSVLEVVDEVRLDHFRGFEDYWEIPAGAPTAETGRWVSGPGVHFFERVRAELGELPIIAEDLGIITLGVTALRKRFDLPGMKVLQFAFTGKPDDPFLPHNYECNYVTYTGTHDNDTTAGWYGKASATELEYFHQYTNASDEEVAWRLIRLAWSSVAVYAIAPMQDFLNLGTRARMNLPGTPDGNWEWRMYQGDLTSNLAERIKGMNLLYNRCRPQTVSELIHVK